MTNFVKNNFEFDGMYLNYAGPFAGQKTYDEVYGTDKIHPSRIGKKKEAFIARFKYSTGGMSAFKKFLCNNFTIEEYLDLLDSGLAPITALETKGYISPAIKKMLKKQGYPQTQEGQTQMLKEWSFA
jgi:hypothetical protein|tara:strand:+ start:172 stop:552 length:381 start_codon:yes stop_codon:yes gene_type:complete